MSKSIITITVDTENVEEIYNDVAGVLDNHAIPVVYNVKVDDATRSPLELFRTDVQMLITATILKDHDIKHGMEHTYTVNLRNYGRMRISERLVMDCKRHCDNMNIKCIVAGDNLVLTVIVSKATLTLTQADLLVRMLKQQEH